MLVDDQKRIYTFRVKVFSSLILAVVWLGTISSVASAAFAIYYGYPLIVLMDAVALCWILAIWYCKKFSYTLRVTSFLGLLYVVAFCSIVEIGPLGLCYLLAPPIMAAVLLGVRYALGTLFLSSASLLVLGLNGLISLPVGDLPSHSAVFISTLNFACLSALTTFACSALIFGLARSMERFRRASKSIKDGQIAQQALNRDLMLTSAAMSALNDMVLITKVNAGSEPSQTIIYANAAFELRTGYTLEAVLGKSMRIMLGPDTDSEIITQFEIASRAQSASTAELIVYDSKGESFWVDVELVPFAERSQEITHWVAVGRDITERRRSSDAVHKLAFFDVLTGLANRRLLMDRLATMLAKAQGGFGHGAVLYIDLDNFKRINDASGHAVGDALLKHVSATLKTTVGPADTVARISGDEFVVLVEAVDANLENVRATATDLARRIVELLGRPFELEGRPNTTSSSVGLAFSGPSEKTVQDLLREADTAMYHAKKNGKNKYAIFVPEMLAAAETNLAIERELLAALNNDELHLVYQPQVDSEQAIVGVEALLRWRRSNGSLISPEIFIPIAEASSLIVHLGHWVLRTACRACVALRAAGFPQPVSVNVSPRQFRDPQFVEAVTSILSEEGISGSNLIFEITEGLLVDNIEQTIERMHKLAAIGIRFSIDDFGTGYSNLGYLSRMPLTELKIDKSFICETPVDPKITAIVQSILALAHNLGLKVVAEGIETCDQASYLIQNGSPAMQGYLFSRPVLFSELKRMLSTQKSIECLR
ncbi:bifunctional diguanylate cyclase/phosphodiesterase [Massilia sp. KIM]|uniref:putative bifunctional diguanylate cyclase/phosphodiesterase n=1 Tax=Massilia sp. KIM TaxID=1955422 RepID=UPI0015C3146E|nr:EAL domain-containing protein [Massilia sp. KIM]